MCCNTYMHLTTDRQTEKQIARCGTSAAPAHEAQVVESRHLVLHDGRRVSQLRGIILIISRHHRDQSPVRNVTQSHHLINTQINPTNPINNTHKPNKPQTKQIRVATPAKIITI